jgi:hypothetical protein
MPCIIELVNIQLEASLHQFQDSYWLRFLSLKRGAQDILEHKTAHWRQHNIPDSDGVELGEKI